MLKGVDISNWQRGLDVISLGVDFCIVKATEGNFFVDGCCDEFIQGCIKSDILWGFYHFARNDTPESEAKFFFDNCKGYIGKGIPVLDYEVWETNNDIVWCERFLDKFHELSSVWPMLYISASRCQDFRNSWVPEKCGLWVAGYPQDYAKWPKEDIPYDVSPWPFAAIWQFTNGLVKGKWKLDGDLAYMNKKAWTKYANPDELLESICNHSCPLHCVDDIKSVDELAHEVINGIWGSGWNRKNALESAGYDYETVQSRVNEILGI